jgi:hypothetical protein
MLTRQITEHIHMYWEKNPQLLIHRTHFCLRWCIIDQGIRQPLSTWADNGGAQLAPSVEQTTMAACLPLCLLLLRFILFQLHRLTPQTALPHLCNWNLSSHQLDTLWRSQSKCQQGGSDICWPEWDDCQFRSVPAGSAHGIEDYHTPLSRSFP